ncbi:MAG: hypothetical protein JWO67_2047 [Streptosporangiaceae bacterium]|nr:hypothetical protein [Streptosporangiaceae bacterium]
MDSYPQEAWQRVGKLLSRRRGQLDPRYRVRKIFAEEVGLKESLLLELENAKRTTFTPPTLASAEAAYRIAHGSIDKALQDPTMTEFPDRVGGSSVQLIEEPQARDGLTVHITDEPEPETPPGTPSGFSDGPLGTGERVIWDLPEPWQRRWGAIQHLRGGTTPLRRDLQGRPQHLPEERRREA